MCFTWVDNEHVFLWLLKIQSFIYTWILWILEIQKRKRKLFDRTGIQSFGKSSGLVSCVGNIFELSCFRLIKFIDVKFHKMIWITPLLCTAYLFSFLLKKMYSVYVTTFMLLFTYQANCSWFVKLLKLRSFNVLTREKKQ